MHINFIYKNNNFNFDIKNDVSIVYLKNLVNKIIKRDNSSFDLFYNNKILSEKGPSIFNIAKNETSIVIIISLKNTSKSKKTLNDSKLKLPVLTTSNKPSISQTESYVKNNANSNESDIFSESEIKDLKHCAKSLSRKNFDQFQKKYITINKVFEDLYKLKEGEIYKLMKNIENKILEFDDVLYKNYKNSSNKDNSQLILFEKNIIDFKDRQIQFLKKILNNFDSKESSFFSMGKINLDDFYLELSNYNKPNLYYRNNAANTIKKGKNPNLKLTLPNSKKLNTLPEININNSINISRDSNKSNEIVKENVEKIFENKKNKKTQKNPSQQSLTDYIKYKNNNINDIPIEKIEKKKENINEFKKENKNEYKKENKNEYKKENKNEYKKINKNEYKKENKNEYKKENKNDEFKKENKNEKISEKKNKYIFEQKNQNKNKNVYNKGYKKELKNENKNKYNNEIDDKYNKYNDESSDENNDELNSENKNKKKIQIVKLPLGEKNNNLNKDNNRSSHVSSNTLDNHHRNITPKKLKNETPDDRYKMDSFDKDKINALFDISENKNENTGNNSANNSKRESIDNLKKREDNTDSERRLKKGMTFVNPKIGYLVRMRERKTTHKLKKLGNNIYDFII